MKPNIYISGILAMVVSGCANLEVNKVPLTERLNGCDHKHDGFRYYVSRPYVVVAQRVDLASNYRLGIVSGLALLNGNGGTEAIGVGIRSLSPDPSTKQYSIYDMSGKILPAASHGTPGWTIVQANGIMPVSYSQDAFTNDQKKQLDRLITQATAKLTPSQETQVVDLIKGQLSKLPQSASLPSKIEVQVNQGSGVASPASPDAFQVVFLPDFEEQMVIKDRNFLGYSKYELNFGDGWQLGGAKGSWDNTEVAVRALQSISNAINAAVSVQKKGLLTLPITEQEIAASGFKGDKDIAPMNSRLVLITNTEYISPGMYRLQKPSEMTNYDKSGVGFLTELGIPSMSDTKVQLIKPGN